MSKGLRIAMVTTYPPGRGTLNEYAYHFVRYLRQKEEVAEVIILADEIDEGTYHSQAGDGLNAPLTIIPCWRFGKKRNSARIISAINRTQPDAILYNIQFASFGGDKMSGALGLISPTLSAKMSNIPTIVLLHNIMETVDLKSAGYAENRVLEGIIRGFGTLFTKMLLSSDLVALTIPKYVEILREKYNADNVVLAPHGSFEDHSVSPSFQLPGGPMQIMTFGKFGTYKRVERLIEAFEILQRNGGMSRPPLELVIAGTDSPNAPNYLSNIRNEFQHVSNVRFTGYVAEEDVPNVFGSAAVVVFPYTSTTGSSGVLHQAGNYGKATVLPNIGDFAEVIKDEGYTGEFFEPDNAQSMAHAIANIIDNPDHRIRLGKQNHLASQGLPISEVVDWYLFHFKALIDQKKKR